MTHAVRLIDLSDHNTHVEAVRNRLSAFLLRLRAALPDGVLHGVARAGGDARVCSSPRQGGARRIEVAAQGSGVDGRVRRYRRR